MSEHARPWSRRALEEGGFTGFVPVARLADAEVPEAPGVYAVLRTADAAPRFADANPAGRFRRKDPTVEVAVLEKAWVEEPEVLYVGTSGNLRERLEDLRRFAAGEPVGHWGGRYLWQLEDRDDLRALYRDMLMGLGHSVVEAASVDEATALTADLPDIGLILSDIRLGAASGIDLADRLKDAGTPIILMTSLPVTDPTHRAALMRAPVLQKPFSADDLAALLMPQAAQ